MAKIKCSDCPFFVLGGTECDGEFAYHVGEGCESETATEAIKEFEKNKPEIMEALKRLEHGT